MNTTENTAENTPEKTVKTETPEVAPYLSKTKKKESDKGNFVIPLILLLVSAIVIIATFYEEEYKNLVADNGSQTTSSEETTNIESLATDDSTSSDITVMQDGKITETANTTTDNPQAITENMTRSGGDETLVAEDSVSGETTKAPTTSITTGTVTPAESGKPDSTMKTEIAEKTRTIATEKTKTAATGENRTKIPASTIDNSIAVNTHKASRIRPDDTSIRARRQEEYNTAMQKRRQSYETEMQNRHQHYEAAMKARADERAANIEARKAIFQRVRQNRIEMNQKINTIHQQISKLHEEIHQIMLESRTAFDKPAEDRTQNPVIEHI